MSVLEGRQPPRFVPTLTDVVPAIAVAAVQEGEVLAPHRATSETESVQPVPSVPPAPPAPPAQVPTLLDVVEPCESAEVDVSTFSIHASAEMAQVLQARVMARLDESLEERLRYALADTVQLQTQALYQAIRQDLEHIVGAAVHDAVAQELALMRSARTD